MNGNQKLLLVLVLILGTGIVAASFFLRERCDGLSSIPASLTVLEQQRRMVGLNTNTDSLQFGVVSPGASIQRSLQVQYAKEAEVQLTVEGDIAAWLEMSPATFSLLPNASQRIIFTVTVPEKAASGNYTGEVQFCFKEN